MDVELQILKHLKRLPTPTVSIIDRYCEAYNDIFPEVRSYEWGASHFGKKNQRSRAREIMRVKLKEDLS